MYHGPRGEQEKELRKLYNEYRATHGKGREKGQWEEVTPYQKGWSRFYVLRDESRNRSDANVLQSVLDWVNYRQYCAHEDFMNRLWSKSRTKKYEPMKQPLKYLTEKEYNTLDERVKSYFAKQMWTEKRTYPTKHYVTITGFVVSPDYHFQLYVEPNIITQHWIPDEAWASHVAELEHKIMTHYLWPKFNKMLGGSTNSHWNDSTRQDIIENVVCREMKLE